MFDVSSAEGLMQLAVVAVPALVLLTLTALFFKRRRARRSAGTVVRLTPEALPAAAVASNPAPVIDGPLHGIGTTVSSQLPAARNVESISQLMSEIRAAEQQGAEKHLAPLYLIVAKAHEEAGDQSQRMSALRSAAGYAALHGPLSAVAQARLALADVALAAGDMTGACEQWQLARAALHADGQTTAHDDVDRRMREAGCPTDWVLNDF